MPLREPPIPRFQSVMRPRMAGNRVAYDRASALRGQEAALNAEMVNQMLEQGIDPAALEPTQDEEIMAMAEGAPGRGRQLSVVKTAKAQDAGRKPAPAAVTAKAAQPQGPGMMDRALDFAGDAVKGITRPWPLYKPGTDEMTPMGKDISSVGKRVMDINQDVGDSIYSAGKGAVDSALDFAGDTWEAGKSGAKAVGKYVGVESDEPVAKIAKADQPKEEGGFMDKIGDGIDWVADKFGGWSKNKLDKTGRDTITARAETTEDNLPTTEDVARQQPGEPSSFERNRKKYEDALTAYETELDAADKRRQPADWADSLIKGGLATMASSAKNGDSWQGIAEGAQVGLDDYDRRKDEFEKGNLGSKGKRVEIARNRVADDLDLIKAGGGDKRLAKQKSIVDLAKDQAKNMASSYNGQFSALGGEAQIDPKAYQANYEAILSQLEEETGIKIPRGPASTDGFDPNNPVYGSDQRGNPNPLNIKGLGGR